MQKSPSVTRLFWRVVSPFGRGAYNRDFEIPGTPEGMCLFITRGTRYSCFPHQSPFRTFPVTVN
jgi:hypothetical protein